MSLVKEYIDSFGGYDAAKEKNTTWMINHGENWRNIKDATLLEYRREHNIFEVGDWVVYRALPHERLFSVRFVGDDEIVVYELWDEMGAKTFTEKHPYSDINHATDEEFKAGHRL